MLSYKTYHTTQMTHTLASMALQWVGVKLKLSDFTSNILQSVLEPYAYTAKHRPIK